MRPTRPTKVRLLMSSPYANATTRKEELAILLQASIAINKSVRERENKSKTKRGKKSSNGGGKAKEKLPSS